MSHSTAEILIKAGKGHLVTKRKDLVKAKGKGELQTYWLSSSSKQAKRQHSSGSSDAGSGRDSTNLSGSVSDIDTNAADLKMRRLIQWNVDVLSRQLKRILAMREVIPISSRKMTTEELEMGEHGTGNQVLDEVKEIIPLSNKAQSYKLDPESVVLPSKVVDQLTDYVSEIANLYHDDNRKCESMLLFPPRLDIRAYSHTLVLDHIIFLSPLQRSTVLSIVLTSFNRL